MNVDVTFDESGKEWLGGVGGGEGSFVDQVESCAQSFGRVRRSEMLHIQRTHSLQQGYEWLKGAVLLWHDDWCIDCTPVVFSAIMSKKGVLLNTYLGSCPDKIDKTCSQTSIETFS